MPSMSIMLEGLVTTLLSLDYMHQKADSSTLTSQQQQQQQRQPNLHRIPSRCRSNSLSSSSSSESESEGITEGLATTTGAIYEYHFPPSEMLNYDDNDTVFGAILRGDLPAVTLAESSRMLALEDIKPRAPLHALVIPKAFVGSVFDIGGGEQDTKNNNNGNSNSDDLDWMMEMQEMALELVKTHHPEAYDAKDYRLCFHIPPFNSVDHLHLHVLAPVSKMGFYYRHIKYNPRTRWCINMEAVMERLQRGETAVPYRRPPTCKPQKELVGLVNQTITAAATTSESCEVPVEEEPLSNENAFVEAVVSETNSSS